MCEHMYIYVFFMNIFFYMHELGLDASEASPEAANRYTARSPSISRAGDVYRVVSEASKRYIFKYI
jgi:hypothetical protein